MAAPLWSSGTLYFPGDLVQPITSPTPAAATIVNATFESGNTGWILNGPWTITNAGSAFDGAWSAEFATGANTTAEIEASAFEPVNPGTSITASAMFNQGASSSGNMAGAVRLKWYTSADAFISHSEGNAITSGANGEWKKSSVTAIAPATAAKVRIAFSAERSGDNAPAWVDNFEWNLIQSSLPAGLIYKAVQAAAGVSGSNEPAWPSTLGLTVVDNEVTWEAVAATRVEYTASPVLVSGSTEPTWPTEIGGFVADGSIKWEAFSRRVEDENCPNSKIVAIVGSKVFAADRDIARFCATANPLDWTTARDAGYLPLGLQQANANDFNTGVFNQYRSNFVAFNASSFLNWQADPDPAQMALLDQMDGVGSTWQQAAQPVANDLFYLAALGVRTVGIAGGSTNLQAGDVGMPIDPLVKDAVRVAVANSSAVRSTYYPSSGQYWLAFADFPPALPSITGNVPDGVVGDTGSGTYTVTGGTLPYGPITVLSGTAPPGLTINQNGTYNYDYTTIGSYSWTVGGVDADGTPFSTPDTAVVQEFWAPTVDAFFIGGIRKLVEGYAGSAIRVRRVSDSVEQDIGFINRTLDTATLALFAGGGSAEVVKIYKQAGAAIDPDFVCADLIKRPMIVSAGTYLGHMQFLSAGSVMALSNNGATNGGPGSGWVGMTTCMKLGVPASATARYVFSKSDANGPYTFTNHGSLGWMSDDTSNITVTTRDVPETGAARNKYPLASLADGTKLSAVWDTAASAPNQVKLYKDGVTPTETFVSSVAQPRIQPGVHYIGGNSGSQYSPCEVHLHSICIYEAALSTAVRESVEAAL